MFNRSAIAREAHRVAHIYRGPGNYRRPLSWGFQQAWRQAKAIAEIERRDAAIPVAERSRRDEAIAIQCATDGRLSAAASPASAN